MTRVARSGCYYSIHDSFAPIEPNAPRVVNVLVNRASYTMRRIRDWVTGVAADAAVAANSSPYPWLNAIYECIENRDSHTAIDLLFEHFDEMLLNENFQECNAILADLDIRRLDDHLIVAFLCMTKRASSHLPARNEFFRRAEVWFMTCAPERVESALGGLA